MTSGVEIVLFTVLTGLVATNAIYGPPNPKHNCIEKTDETTRCNRGCTPGFFGPFCNKTCSRHCHEACSQDTGHCLTGCNLNWFNSTCTRKCSRNCKDGVCDMRSGDCIMGCKDGYYGAACDRNCSGNCIGGSCDEFGGCRCAKEVRDNSCYVDCSDNCIDGQCEATVTGHLVCVKGCQPGRTGSYCQEWCPGNCLKCNSEKTCIDRDADRSRTKRDAPINCMVETDGDCLCCKEGWRGRRCHIQCSNCVYNFSNKKCRSACKEGYFGKWSCHLNCSGTCSEGTNERPVCAKDSGKCHSGCIQGFYGYTCRDLCSISCLGRTCFQNNGICVECEPGKYGPRCEDDCGYCIGGKCERNGICKCQTGWYGLKCKDMCSDKCKSSDCRVDILGNHLCVGECIDGYTGDQCVSVCPPGCRKCDRKLGTCQHKQIGELQQKNEDYWTMLIVSWIGASVVVMVVIGLSVTICCIRKVNTIRRNQSSDESDCQVQDAASPPPLPPHVETPLMTKEHLSMTDMVSTSSSDVSTCSSET